MAGNGQGGFSGDGGPATSAQLYGEPGVTPGGIAVDSAGNLYIADSGNNRIRKVTPQGIISTVAGNGQSAYDGDGGSGDGGPATSAQLFKPAGVAVDSAGNLYIAASGRIRKVTPQGTISTVAGNGGYGFSGDGGPAISAEFASPVDVAVDAAGNLYIADWVNSRIRKVTSNGIIGTVAGNGTPGNSGDGGIATNAELANPTRVALDAAGNLYIADTGNFLIRKVDASGTINTVAGDGAKFLGVGPATSAWLSLPNGVAADASGNLYIADSGNNRVAKVTADGTISTVAGIGTAGFSGDGGPAARAQFSGPTSVAVDAAGNLYIADQLNHCVRKVTPGGAISTVAGNGQGGFSGDGGPAANAQLNFPRGVAVDPVGNLYIADFSNSRIRKVTSDGIISTVAGNGQPGSSGDGGLALNAQLAYPAGVAFDAARNLYIADGPLNGFGIAYYPSRIRKVDTEGTISTVAGMDYGFSGDGGPATSAALCFPQGMAVDAAGNIYIADSGNNRVRKVDANGTISTVAGNGVDDFSGDGGPSTCATLQLNFQDYDKIGGGVAVDPAGNLYIADWFNNRIRKVTGPALPCLSASGVNSASFSTGASAPGSIVSLFGYDLAAEVQGSAPPMDPVVTINNVPATLLYASPTLINLQVPFEVPLGSVPLELSRGTGGTATSSLIVAAVSPGIFSMDGSGTGQGAIVTSTGEVAAPAGSVSGQPARPARHGEVISIFLTGLGDVTNRPPNGSPAPIPPPFSETLLTTTLTIGGVTATPVFSGLAPLFVGLYQVNVQVPDAVPTGNAIQMVLTIGGVASNAVTMAVQ